MLNKVLSLSVAAAPGLKRSEAATKRAVTAERGAPAEIKAAEEGLEIATRLLLELRPGEQVIACAGVSSEDPTASLAGDLGAALAALGHEPVLLLAAHPQEGYEQGPGFCDLLREGGDITNAIRATQTPGLSVLPRGDRRGAARLFAAAQCKQTIDALRRFKYVLVDVGALLGSPESLLLARQADVLFATASAGAHNRKDLLRLREEVARLEARFLGIVLVEDR